MDKSTHEEHLSQSLQTKKKQLKVAVTFLPGYNGNFSVTDENNKLGFTKSIIDDDFIQIIRPKEVKRLKV